MRDRGGAYPPLVELTLARLREFLREPEALFWVFVFPILMACALGVAFRARGDEPVVVGVVGGAGAQQVTDDPGSARRGVTVRALGAGEIARALQRADVQVVVEPGTPPVYHLDPTRAESRLARRTVDDLLQRAAGRVGRLCGARGADRGDRVALHRLAAARPAGHEHHEHGPLGPGLLDRPGAHAQAAQAAHRLAHAPARLPAGAVVRAPGVSRHRGRRAAAASVTSPSACRCAARIALLAGHLPGRRGGLWRPRPAGGQPRAHHRGRVGPAEPRDAADVGALGRVLFGVQLSRRRCSRSSRRCR